MTKLKIIDLRADSTLRQVVRGKIDDDVVERYTTAMRAGLWDFARSLEPITAFFDGEGYWLADGYHRVIAAKRVPWSEVEVEVHQGTARDALWHAFSANAQHGHARSRDDVGRILRAIFADEEWAAIPLREIARHTRIAYATVHDHFKRLSDRADQIAKPATRTVTRGGKSFEMDTTGIGKTPPPAKGKARDDALMAEAVATGDVIVDMGSSKRYDPMSRAERAENERRKLLSMEIIEVLELFANNDVTPERAAREFFGPVAHFVDPALQPAVDWLIAFEKEWQQCKPSSTSATS